MIVQVRFKACSLRALTGLGGLWADIAPMPSAEPKTMPIPPLIIQFSVVELGCHVLRIDDGHDRKDEDDAVTPSANNELQQLPEPAQVPQSGLGETAKQSAEETCTGSVNN
jgi:hypothetical protein